MKNIKNQFQENNPTPFYNNEVGSFAEFTLQSRFPEIWNSVFKYYPWNDFIENHKVMEFLLNTKKAQKLYLEQFSDKTLKEFFYNSEFLRSEFFLYHIILEKWKSEGNNILELFFAKKKQDWPRKEDNPLISTLVNDLLHITNIDFEIFKKYLNFMLTGNAHDLSQENNYKPEENIKLINKDIFKCVFDLLNEKENSRIDILADNAGCELLSDILFSCYLLKINFTQQIIIHLKPLPMFVSDATKGDYDFIRKRIEYEYPQLGSLLIQYEKDKQLIIQSDEEELFYVPYFKDCKFIKTIIKAGCRLLIVKGDLNYRRLVGDLKWENTQPIKPIIAPFITCRCLCLRCIKSDVLLGLTKEEAAEVNNIPRHELTKGKFATIQFI